MTEKRKPKTEKSPAPPADQREEFSHFEQLTRRLLKVSKTEIDEQRRKA